MWYGIWSFIYSDWLRPNYHCELKAILAFKSKKDACKRAAEFYGFDSYKEVKRKGWCEVRKLEC